jgi:hypothetical protein
MMPLISLASANDRRNKQSVGGHILSFQYFFLGAKKTINSFVQADMLQDILYLEKATLQKEIAEAVNESSCLSNKHPSLQYFTM